MAPHHEVAVPRIRHGDLVEPVSCPADDDGLGKGGRGRDEETCRRDQEGDEASFHDIPWLQNRCLGPGAHAREFYARAWRWGSETAVSGQRGQRLGTWVKVHNLF